MLHEAVLTVPGTSYATAVASFYDAMANDR